MVALARERLGDDADIEVADLGERLPYADDSFDTVVCSLALHYLKDLRDPLAELRRVLRPRGRLVISVSHPVVYMLNYPKRDYFALNQYSDDVVRGGRSPVRTPTRRRKTGRPDGQAGPPKRAV